MLKDRIHWFAALLVSMSMVTCARYSDEPAPADDRRETLCDAAARTELDHHLERATDAACRAHVRCADAASPPIGIDTSMCHPAYMERWRGRARAAVRAGHARVDSVAVEAILTSFADEACEDLVEPWNSVDFARDTLIVGEVQLGDACTDSLECASGRCDGVCVTRHVEEPIREFTFGAKLSEVCGDQRCGDNLRCVGGGSPARCVHAVLPGGVCDAESYCQQGYACTAGRCTALPTIGGTCTSSLGCLEGLCDSGLCRAGQLDETCSDSGELALLLPGNESCAEGLHCDLSHLRCIAP